MSSMSETNSRYIVNKEIARGGQAVVYDALRKLADGTRQPVALKRLLQEKDIDARRHYAERFRREAHMGLALAHPGLVKVYDLDTEKGEPVIVMERIDGVSLMSLACQEPGKKLRAPMVRRIMMDVADVLSHLHNHGIIHRDVTPNNIMITRYGEVKLIDLGLAKPRDIVTGQPGMKGTPAYASPEALLGEEVDASSDFFQLTVIAFHLLTGELPFGITLDDRLKGLDYSRKAIAKIPADFKQLIEGNLRPHGKRLFPDALHVLGLLDDHQLKMSKMAALGKLVCDVTGQLPKTLPQGAIPLERKDDSWQWGRARTESDDNKPDSNEPPHDSGSPARKIEPSPPKGKRLLKISSLLTIVFGLFICNDIAPSSHDSIAASQPVTAQPATHESPERSRPQAQSENSPPSVADATPGGDLVVDKRRPAGTQRARTKARSRKGNNQRPELFEEEILAPLE